MKPTERELSDAELEALAKDVEETGLLWRKQNNLQELPIIRVSVDYVTRHLIFTEEKE